MTQVSTEIRYRLRKDDRIVGYAREVYGRTYYSIDNFWWSGERIGFIQKDHSTGIRDKNNRFLYENDIILLIQNNKKRYFTIIFDEILERFCLLDLEENELLTGRAEDHILGADKFEFISFQFIN